MTPPTRIIRVEHWQGYGWPRCTERQLRRRTFDDEDAALRHIARILARPTHDVLVGVWLGDASWERVDVDAPFGNLARMIRENREHMGVLPTGGIDPVPYTYEGSTDDGED